MRVYFSLVSVTNYRHYDGYSVPYTLQLWEVLFQGLQFNGDYPLSSLETLTIQCYYDTHNATMVQKRRKRSGCTSPHAHLTQQRCKRLPAEVHTNGWMVDNIRYIKLKECKIKHLYFIILLIYLYFKNHFQYSMSPEFYKWYFLSILLLFLIPHCIRITKTSFILTLIW